MSMAIAQNQNNLPRWAQHGQPVDITNAAFKADPFPFYAWLRAEHPVYKARLGQKPVWLVTRYDDVMALLKDERFVKNPANVGDTKATPPAFWLPGFFKAMATNMLDQDDPNHARLRALVQKAFTPARVEQMQADILATCHRLLDRVEAQGHMDLVADFALQLPLTVISELMGIPEPDRLRFHQWVKAGLQPPSTAATLLALPKLWAMVRYLRQQFAARRLHPQEDLLSALVQAEEAGDKLSEDELLGMAVILLIAGYETTVNLLASGTLALLQHPEQCQLLRANPALIKPAIEELLRFCAPVEQATERYAREEVTIAGVTIPQGALVLAVLAAANRDEHYFANPDQLEITRDKNRHFAFGYGAHSCIGMPLARLEGTIAINTLLARLPKLRLAVPADQLRWRATPMVRGLVALPVAFS